MEATTLASDAHFTRAGERVSVRCAYHAEFLSGCTMVKMAEVGGKMRRDLWCAEVLLCAVSHRTRSSKVGLCFSGCQRVSMSAPAPSL